MCSWVQIIYLCNYRSVLKMWKFLSDIGYLSIPVISQYRQPWPPYRRVAATIGHWNVFISLDFLLVSAMAQTHNAITYEHIVIPQFIFFYFCFTSFILKFNLFAPKNMSGIVAATSSDVRTWRSVLKDLFGIISGTSLLQTLLIPINK